MIKKIYFEDKGLEQSINISNEFRSNDIDILLTKLEDKKVSKIELFVEFSKPIIDSLSSILSFILSNYR